MAYQKHPVGILIDGDPATASARILEAYRKAGCSQVEAARVLEVAESTYIRWVKRLGLERKLMLIRRAAIKEGQDVQMRGRPRKAS